MWLVAVLLHPSLRSKLCPLLKSKSAGWAAIYYPIPWIRDRKGDGEVHDFFVLKKKKKKSTLSTTEWIIKT